MSKYLELCIIALSRKGALLHNDTMIRVNSVTGSTWVLVKMIVITALSKHTLTHPFTYTHTHAHII